ncbi:MAG TPA: hypothetical protein VMV98_08205 [Acidobacteriaceae bacterium]|nr:hypothetical protein [Acidobacteriaceae bacterium]
MQIETWGYDATDVIPLKSFLLAQKIGGQVIGAFDVASAEGKPGSDVRSLVGFALSLPAIRTRESKPEPYLHSHMLAVREGYRDRGLGAQLKWEQRREALARGIRHMEWTFDPLEIKNSFLNLHRLGAIVRGYRVNFYGVSSSRLQGGLPTDRLLAEWHLDSSRVQAILDGRPAAKHVSQEQIVVPASIYAWKASETDRERALAVLLANRQKFQDAFSRDLAVLDFVRDAEGNGIFEIGSFNQQELI